MGSKSKTQRKPDFFWPMGLELAKGLSKMYSTRQPVQKNPGDLRGKKVAIDTSVSLYQFLTKKTGEEAKNGIDTSYLLGMFERVSS